MEKLEGVVFREAEVSYTRNALTAWKLGFKRFEYVSEHIPTGTRFSSPEYPHEIYVCSEKSFMRLLAYWNRTKEWRYSPWKEVQ